MKKYAIALKIAELTLKDIVYQVGELNPSLHQRKTEQSDPKEIIMQLEKMQKWLENEGQNMSELVNKDILPEHHKYPEIRGLVKYLVEDSTKPKKVIY
jgi:ribosomal protein S16